MNPILEQIKPETIQKLAALAIAHGFRSIDDFVERSLPAPGGENDMAKPFYERATPEEWVKAFREWAASHPALPVIADDSRESIYEGRGE